MFKSIMLFVIVLLLIIAIPLLIFFISNSIDDNEEEDKNEDNAEFIKGLEYFIIEDYDKAYETMCDTIKKDKKNHMAYYVRGLSQIKSKHFVDFQSYDEPKRDFEKALKLKPDFIQCKEALSEYLLQLFIDELYSGIVLHGEVPKPNDNLRKMDNTNELDKIIELNEQNHKAYYYRGLYKYLKRTEMSERDSNSINLDIFNELADFDKAIQYAPYPGNAEYYLARAISRIELNENYTGAIEDYDNYMISSNRSVIEFWSKPIPKHEVFFKIGKCYHKLKDIESAKNYFRLALAVCPHKDYKSLKLVIGSYITDLSDD